MKASKKQKKKSTTVSALATAEQVVDMISSAMPERLQERERCVRILWDYFETDIDCKIADTLVDAILDIVQESIPHTTLAMNTIADDCMALNEPFTPD